MAEGHSKRTVQKIISTLSRVRDGAVSLFEKFNMDVGYPAPRKGEFFEMGQLQPSGGPGEKRKTKDRRKRMLDSTQIQNLADTDPITWAIRKARRDQIAQCAWSINRDIDDKETALDHWYDILSEQLNPWGHPPVTEYVPTALNNELIGEVRQRVGEILNSTGDTTFTKKAQIRWLFERIKNRLRFEADQKIPDVEYIFKHPNRDFGTWNQFMAMVADDMLVSDAGVLVKNWNQKGDKLAELYTRPGHEIYIWRNEDGTVPYPPDTAFSWEKEGKEIAKFGNDELIYIVQNPQHDYYGFSPVEAVAYVITGTLYADDLNLTMFQSNMPPGVMDLGKGVSPTQRRYFKTMWENEVSQRGGLHRLLFISGTEGANFIPVRPYTAKDMQMLEYLKWSLSIKSACFQISPQDIGFTMDLHRTTAQVQYEISKDRGLKTILRSIQEYVNTEIIEKEFEADEVKFEYDEEMKGDDQQQSALDQVDLNNGVISRNKRRSHIGEPPAEGGDVVIVDSPLGPVPLAAMDDVAEFTLLKAERQAAAILNPELAAEEGISPDGEPVNETAQGGQAPNAQAPKPGAPVQSQVSKPSPQSEVKVASKDTASLNRVMKRLAEEGLGDRMVKISFEEEIDEDFGEYLVKRWNDMAKMEGDDPIRFDDYDQKKETPFQFGLKRGTIQSIAGEVDPNAVQNIASNNGDIASASVASILGMSLLVFGGKKAAEGLGKGLKYIFSRGSTAAKRAVPSWFRRHGISMRGRDVMRFATRFAGK